MATPPTFVAERGPDVWNSSSSPKSATAFTPASGNILVAGSVEESDNTAINISGGPTWTDNQEVNAASYTRVKASTATGAGSSATVSFSEAASTANWWGADIVEFSGSDGIGNTAKTNFDSPYINFTTSADNSAVVIFIGDWNAADGSSRAWLSVNGAAPTELSYFRSSTRYTIYAAYYADAGAAGTHTYGLSTPSAGATGWSVVAVEVKGHASGATQNITAAGAIASAEAFGTGQLNQTLHGTGLASAEAFGSATVTPGPVTVSPSAVGSTEAFGTATVSSSGGTQSITGAGAIGTAETFGTTTVSPGPISVVPSGIASGEALGAATVSPGPVTVSPTGISSAEAEGTPVVAGPVTVTGIASAEAFGNAIVSSGTTFIVPSGIASTEAVGTPTVTPGPVTVSPSGIGTAEAVGSATVTTGPVTVSPTGISSSEAFGTTSVGASNQTISPSGIASSETVGSATVYLGNDMFENRTVLTGYAGTSTFNNTGYTDQANEMSSGGGHAGWFEWTAPASGTVTFDTLQTTDPLDTKIAIYQYDGTGLLNLSNLSLLGSNDDFSGSLSLLTHAVTEGTTYYIQAGLFGGAGAGDIVVHWSLPTTVSPSGIGTGGGFGTPTVAPGAVTLSPSGIASSEGLGSPAATATYEIDPDPVTTGEAFGTAVLTPGPVTVTQSEDITSGERFGRVRVRAQRCIFRAPTVSEQAMGRMGKPRNWRLDEGITVLKIDGIYREVRWPSDDEIASATAIYRGGYEIEVTAAEKADLEAAGYTTAYVDA